MDFILGKIWFCFYLIAMFATILFVIKLVLFTIAGSDSEVMADFNTETDTDASFSFLSIQSILAFLMGFGWMGYAALKQFGLNIIISVILALIVGAIFMWVNTFLMFKVRSLESSVNKDKKSAIGNTGKAYTHFDKRGYGKIEVEISGQLTVVNAFNDSDKEIKSFEPIIITNFVQDVLYVKKIDEDKK